MLFSQFWLWRLVQLENEEFYHSALISGSSRRISGTCCAISGSYWVITGSYFSCNTPFWCAPSAPPAPWGNSNLNHLGVRRVTRVSFFLKPLINTRARKSIIHFRHAFHVYSWGGRITARRKSGSRSDSRFFKPLPHRGAPCVQSESQAGTDM